MKKLLQDWILIGIYYWPVCSFLMFMVLLVCINTAGRVWLKVRQSTLCTQRNARSRIRIAVAFVFAIPPA
jgi:hypothetical protein